MSIRGLCANEVAFIFFVVKPFYQQSWDGDKGSADDVLNGETVCGTLLPLPALHSHSSLSPLSYFEGLPQLPQLPLAHGWNLFFFSQRTKLDCSSMQAFFKKIPPSM